MTDIPEILVVCTHDAGRSVGGQAEGLAPAVASATFRSREIEVS